MTKQVTRNMTGQMTGQHAADVIGEGSASAGAIWVTARTGGEIDPVVIDPRVMRESPETVGALIHEAVNAALDDLSAKLGEPPESVAGLAEELAEAQELALERMSMFAEGLDDALRELGKTTGRQETCDLAPSELARAMDGVSDALTSVRTPAGDGTAAGVDAMPFEGSAAEGRVRVVIDAGARVISVELDRRALREGSELLGERVAEAVDDARVSLRDRAGDGSASGRALIAELQRMQEGTAERMAAFLDGLRVSLDQISRAAGTGATG